MKTRTSASLIPLALAAFAITSTSALRAQADFPYTAKSVVRSNHTLTPSGTGTFLTVTAPEASTTAGGDVYRIFAHAPTEAQTRLYDSRARTVIESNVRALPGIGGQPGELDWVYDADTQFTQFTVLQARVPKGASFRATILNASTRSSQTVQFMFSKNQPLVLLKSGSTIKKSWSLLPNGTGDHFQLRSGDRFVKPFVITAANRYVLRYLSNTSTSYPQQIEVISLTDLPKWQAGGAVTAKASFITNAWEKPLVLPAGNYAFVAKYVRGIFYGAFDLLEYRPTPTSTWAALKGDFPILPVNKHLSAKLLGSSGTSQYAIWTTPVPITSSKGNSFSVLAASSHASVLPAVMSTSQVPAFTAFKALSPDPAQTIARSTPGLYLKSHFFKTFVTGDKYALGVRNDSPVSSVHGNPFNMLISRDIDTVSYSASGKSKVWARQPNSLQASYNLGYFDYHVRHFTITADARYVIRYVSDEKTGTAPENLYVCAKSELMQLKINGAVTEKLVLTGKSVERALSLPAGDYFFVAVSNGYLTNNGAYELIEYR